jgi:P4 family phage/plasmid primase-like protien
MRLKSLKKNLKNINIMTVEQIKSNLINQYNTTDKSTHTFINGGKLYVPKEQLQSLYSILSENKINPPLTERVNAYDDEFKFFIDIDDEKADLDKVIDITLMTIDKLFILTEEQKRYTVWKNSNKNKYHIIFQFKTNKNDALNLIELATGDIDVDLDKSVYNTGLRLPYCNKDKINKKDDSVYYYHSGYKPNDAYLLTGSILYTDNLPDTKYTDEYVEFLNQLPDTTDEDKFDEEKADKVSCILNDMFDMKAIWKCDPGDNGYKITHNSYRCLVDNTVNHSDKLHSAIFIHKRSCSISCYSHGKKKILKKDYPELTKLKEVLGLAEKKKEKKDLTQMDYNHIDLTDEDYEFIFSKMSTTHEDVACIFHRFFKDKYVCGAEVPKAIWYEYDKGLWKNTDGSSKLRKDFTNKLIDIYMTSKKRADLLYEQTDDINYDLHSKVCIEVCIKLKTTGFTDSLCKQIIHHFKYNDFIEQLDKHRNLLCFGEDVYDLNKNEWRKTTPQDLCSRRCGVSKDDVNDTYLEELMNIIVDIHPDEDRREFFLSSLSDLLYGKNTKEIFHIWTGTGRNGKGVISEILKHAFGDYYCSPSVSLITQKRASSNSANPELAQTRGARIVMFTEPEEGSKLNNSIIKQYTGGDDLTTRALFCNPFSFTPHFTPIIQCNTFSMQDVKDDSIPDRTLFMKFKTSFVDEPTMDWQRKKNERLKDEDTMVRLKGAMMFLLINKWRELSPHHKFKPPQSVIDDKNEFLDDNNNIKQFVDENIEFTDDKNDLLKAKELLSDYKTYMEDRGERVGKMTLKMFIGRMSKYMPEYKERHQGKKDDGSQMNVRNVFLRCKMNVDDNY